MLNKESYEECYYSNDSWNEHLKEQIVYCHIKQMKVTIKECETCDLKEKGEIKK